jgi:tRNA-splicing ligase RtcB (3'-phosphate/5'-hydroxy nucleic acid ligase)
MAISEIKGKNVPIKLWTPIHEVESEALDQLKRVASLPWVFKQIAVMADVHVGKGCTIGSVIAMKGAVSPACVGVDLSCGMAAVKTNLTLSDLPDDLNPIRQAVESAIPVGFNHHSEPAWSKLKNRDLKARCQKLMNDFGSLTQKVGDLEGKASRQLGSLGQGNHFAEMNCDTNNDIWLMLHSGSRNIGKTLAEFHINIAKKLAHNQDLPDKDLAVFLAKTPEMEAYRHDLYWAQDYAFFNREVMLELYKNAIRSFFPQVQFETPVNCHHNYISEVNFFGEDLFLTRKGAISAQAGELGIIPGSMGTKSYIVRGLGNEEAFCSASHGAGRRMSRGKAKKHFTVADLESQTAGVCCRKDSGVLDEIPGAYKDIDQVMENQKDLVEVVAELKQVMCIKG